MTFYHLGGAHGLTPVNYDAYHSKHTNNWRYVLAFVLLLMVLGSGVITTKTFASIEETNFELPKSLNVVAPDRPTISVPLVAPAVDHSPELKSDLLAWQAKQKGSQWAFYVQSLDNKDLEVGIDETEQSGLASIYKLYLIKTLAQKIPAEAWGNTKVTSRTYLDCVDAMLSVSDNPCAEAIASKLGWSAMHRQNQADGYKSTVFNKVDNLVGSPADVGLLLSRLFHGEGYDAKTKQIALDALGKTKKVEALRKGCSGCTVYNKTGDFNGARHDAGIVIKDGKAYVVVIFSKSATWSQLVEASTVISKHL